MERRSRERERERKKKGDEEREGGREGGWKGGRGGGERERSDYIQLIHVPYNSTHITKSRHIHIHTLLSILFTISSGRLLMVGKQRCKLLQFTQSNDTLQIP